MRLPILAAALSLVFTVPAIAHSPDAANNGEQPKVERHADKAKGAGPAAGERKGHHGSKAHGHSGKGVSSQGGQSGEKAKNH